MLIKEENKFKIENFINNVQKRTKARNINYSDIINSIEKIEKYLNIPKNKMIGIEAWVDINAQDFPKAYKYTPESTQFKIVRKKSGWDLECLARQVCNKSSNKFEIELTELAKLAILSRYERPFI